MMDSLESRIRSVLCIQEILDIVDEYVMEKGKRVLEVSMIIDDAVIASYISVVFQLINKLVWIRVKNMIGSMYWYTVRQGCVLKSA